MSQISAIRFDGQPQTFTFNTQPNECPFCHNSITARIHQGFQKGTMLEIVFRCPDSSCGRIFSGLYENTLVSNSWIYTLKSTSIGTFVEKNFSENITNLSNNFVDIYNQAAKAESLNLHHIAGIGYRKALEFLIKDYLIIKNPEKEEVIKKKFLGKCIKEDIQNVNLKEIAERATWLGNDETHYVRQWEDKDISDLKVLINISLHWIDMELLTEQYKNEMQ